MRESATGTRRALIALVVLVGLVVATGGWQIRESRLGITAQVLERNEELARAAAAAVEQQMEAQFERLRFVASRPELADLVRARDPDRAQTTVGFFSILYPDYDTVMLADAHGVLLASWPADQPASSAPDPTALTAARATNDVVVTRADLPSGVHGLHLTVALRDDDGVAGYLRLGLPIDHVRVFRPSSADADRRSIAFYDGRGLPLEDGPPLDAEQRRAFSPGLSGRGSSTLPGRSGPSMVGWATVPTVGWTVVVEQPRATALRPAGALATRLGIIAVLVSLLVAISAWFVGRLLRQVSRERTRTSAILASLADGAVTTDAGGKVRSINPAMESLTGTSSADVTGRPLEEVVRLLRNGEPVGRDDDVLLEAIRSRAPAASRGYDVGVQACDGSIVPVGVNAAPILTSDGSLIGGVAVYRDVTYERELDQMKSSLVSTVSHELRTPLTMIQGFSELLLTREVEPARATEAIRHINASADRLSRLIEDLLQVSHLEAGHVPVALEPTDPTYAIDEALAPFREQHTDRSFRVTGHGVPSVVGDHDMLVRILTNLVSNAVKYSPAGTRVTVGAEQDGDRVVIRVRDRGIGMSGDEAAHLFQKFFRSSRPEVQRVGGTGLGLYITRGLVQLQRGEIWAESEPGRGATFSVALPVAAINEGAIA